MYETSADIIIAAFNSMDILLVIFARVIGFLIILPIFSGGYVNNQVKVGFAILVTYLIFLNKLPIIYFTNTQTETVFGFGILLFQEFIVGYALGFSVYLFMSTFYFAGQIIDFQIGFSMVNVFDAMSQMQVPITGNIMYFIMAVFLIRTGGLDYLLSTFFESYKILPIATSNIFSNPALPTLFLNAMSTIFQLGLRIAIPISGTIILIDFTLGILVKAVPQMNVFVVGMPIKLIIGFFILYLVIPTYIEIYEYAFTYIVELFKLVLEGMIYNVS